MWLWHGMSSTGIFVTFVSVDEMFAESRACPLQEHHLQGQTAAEGTGAHAGE